MNSILNGHNTEQGIIAVHQISDQSIRLYQRVDGKIQYKDVEFFPFFFLSDPSLLHQFNKHYWIKELTGTNHFRYLVVFSHWSEMWEAVRHIHKTYNATSPARVASYNEIPSLLLRNDAVRQLLLQSEMTLFKGMGYNNFVRLYVDVQQALPIRGKKGKRYTQSLWTISAISSSGDVFQKSAIRNDDKTMLTEFIKFVQKVDPDVIIGEHLSDNIIPLLLQRAENCQIEFNLGRDNSPPRLGTNRLPFLSPESFVHPVEIIGRHALDLHSLVETTELFRHPVQNYSLFALAAHCGIECSIVPTTHGELINWWIDSPSKVLDYSRQRLDLVSKIADNFLPHLFYTAQLCPFSLSMLAQLPPAAYIESLMLREYLRQRYSVPQPQAIERTEFLPPLLFQSGVFKNILYGKLDNLFTAALRKDSLSLSSDELQIFPKIQQALEQEIKFLPQTANVEYPQKAFLFLLNALPLMVGNPKSLFNCKSCADKLLQTEASILRSAVEICDRFNAAPIQSERDSLFLAMPDNVQDSNAIESFVQRINSAIPQPLHLRKIKVYKAMFSYKRRAYALLNQNNSLKVYGSLLMPKTSERYLRTFAMECILYMMTDNFEKLHQLYGEVYTNIVNHKWTPADFSRIEVAKENSTEYEASLTRGAMPSPGMEAARRGMKYVARGDEIAYYISGSHPDVKITEVSMLAEEWNPISPKENTAYYLERLQELIQRLKDFFNPIAFETIFSTETLFGIELPSPPLVVHRHSFPEENPSPSENDFGIWLAEENPNVT